MMRQLEAEIDPQAEGNIRTTCRAEGFAEADYTDFCLRTGSHERVKRSPSLGRQPFFAFFGLFRGYFVSFMARVETTTLYRPVGPEELELIKQSNWSAFPPRLPEQPIFYPVLNEEYARQIARDWNVRASGAGFVTKFEVESDYLKQFNVQVAGGSEHAEYWIPAEELAEFNRHIIGKIEVIAEFRTGS
jgi:hypothetical protein